MDFDEELTPASPQPTRKRPRAEKSRVGVAYPRKRAVAACQLCRARKVKCNNARPSCSSCLASSSSCVYEDPKDHSAFDPASILILDRLDQVLTKLDQSPALLTPPLAPSEPSPSTFSHVSEPITHLAHGQAGIDKLQIPSVQTTLDSVLSWPVLEGRYAPGYIIDQIFEAENPNEFLSVEDTQNLQRRHRLKNGGTDEDGIPELIELFLKYVHTKNPILDVDTIRSYARQACEEGFQWDAQSCLVLIACALGSVARPFHSDVYRSHQTSLECDENMLRIGESYYNLACRRFGFLKDGILSTQCFFLAGVYFMYTMKPLAAWSQFHSASRSYHMYLKFQAHQGTRPDTTAAVSKLRRLEQSLYWSCYKAECELRVEIDVPHSSLADLHYPHSHPSPPYANIQGLAVDTPSPSNGAKQLFCKTFDLQEQEGSWYYYLTEITLRRISNSILNTFYAGDYTRWSSEQVPFMTRAAAEFKQQLDEWYVGLPTPIHYDEDELPFDELPYMVRSRLLEIQLYIHQPFLHYAIHSPETSPHYNAVLPLAEAALFYSFRYMQDEPIRHRHHGSWFGIRSSIAACLYVLAATRCETVPVRSDWKERVISYIDRLRYWEDEVPWIAKAINILQSYL